MGLFVPEKAANETKIERLPKNFFLNHPALISFRYIPSPDIEQIVEHERKERERIDGRLDYFFYSLSRWLLSAETNGDES